MMNRSSYSRLGVSMVLLGAASAACEGPGTSPSEAAGDTDDTEWTEPGPADDEPQNADPEIPDSELPPLIPPAEELPPALEGEPPPEGDASACRPPPGVSGSPRTIAQAVELMNALPRPATVACFIESLDRPLEVYLTSSRRSAQPALDERNPRTFIVFEPLFISIVPDGDFASLVELGQRTADDRSIKAEVAFPLTRDVTEATLYQQIGLGNASICGACHIGESFMPDDFFTEGAFESSVIPPFPLDDVPLDSLRAEADNCDADLEPARCAILSALFEGGEVKQTVVWAEADR